MSIQESGEGRYDILLIPHDKTKYGIVIEIKQITKNENDDTDGFNKKIDDSFCRQRTIYYADKQREISIIYCIAVNAFFVG